MMRRESQTMSLCEVQDVLSARSQKVFIGLMKSDLRCRQCTFYAVCLYEQKLSMFCVDTLVVPSNGKVALMGGSNVYASCVKTVV